jgi:hypothetical protein
MQFLMLVNYSIQAKVTHTLLPTCSPNHSTTVKINFFHWLCRHHFPCRCRCRFTWLAMSPTCRGHVGPTAKCRHIWPTCPCRGDTKLIPTASCCSCVAGGQRLLLLFGPPRCCCRGRHGVIIIVDHPHLSAPAIVQLLTLLLPATVS